MIRVLKVSGLILVGIVLLALALLLKAACSGHGSRGGH